LHIEHGCTKEELVDYRNQYYARIKAALEAELSGTVSTTTQPAKNSMDSGEDDAFGKLASILAQLKPKEGNPKEGNLGDQPPEYSEKFKAADAGLSAAVLAALPPEPPPGHAAFERCRLRFDSYGGGVIPCVLTRSGETIRCQAAVKTVGSNYAAFRVARALYVHMADGCSKEELNEYRAQYYARVQEALRTEGGTSGDAGTNIKKQVSTSNVVEPSEPTSTSEDEESDGAPAEPPPVPKKEPPRVPKNVRVAAKMLVRASYCCACHYELRCPGVAGASEGTTKRGQGKTESETGSDSDSSEGS